MLTHCSSLLYPILYYNSTRSFHCVNKILIYKLYVRPIITYAIPTWMQNINKITTHEWGNLKRLLQFSRKLYSSCISTMLMAESTFLNNITMTFSWQLTLASIHFLPKIRLYFLLYVSPRISFSIRLYLSLYCPIIKSSLKTLVLIFIILVIFKNKISKKFLTKLIS